MTEAFPSDAEVMALFIPPGRRKPVCVNCRERAVCSHEIVPKSRAPRTWRRATNRVAMCNPCHRRVHEEGTRKWEARLRLALILWEGWTMIHLRKNGLFYKLYELTLLTGDDWRLDETNFCHLFWSLTAKLPFIVAFVVMVLPLAALLAGYDIVADFVKKRWPRMEHVAPVRLGPSRLRMWWDTIHGRLCPTVKWE
jgi:hypothetical protein